MEFEVEQMQVRVSGVEIVDEGFAQLADGLGVEIGER